MAGAVQRIHSTFAVLLLIMSAANAAYHQIIQTYDTNDRTIQSGGFPGPYPPDTNITWQWRTDTGQWAVVFFDFVLDKDTERHKDWLEIDDGKRRIRYTDTTAHQKDLTITTPGPNLTIRFISDYETNSQSRGFRIKVLYGKSESHLVLRVHDARKLENKRKVSAEEDDDHTMLIVLATLLGVVVLIFILVVIAFLIHQRHLNKDSYDFGMLSRERSGSRISHSRDVSVRRQESRDNDNPQQEQQQVQEPQQQQQQQQQNRVPIQRSASRSSQRSRQLRHQNSTDSLGMQDQASRAPRPSVQRSTSNSSQMCWMTRAGFSTSSLQAPKRKSKQNAYTNMSDGTTACSPSDSSTDTSNVNSPDTTIPYMDVKRMISEQPSATSQQSNDYDNIETVFGAGLADKGLDGTCGSCNNLYTNTYLPPAYQWDPDESQNTDKKEIMHAPDEGEGLCCVPQTIADRKGSKNDDLYVNLPGGDSQQDKTDFREGTGALQKQELYGNVWVGAMAQETGNVTPVTNDSMMSRGNNSSINGMVSDVKREAGGAATGGKILIKERRVSDDGQPFTIYDVPPPSSGNSGEASGYINFDDMEMKSKSKSLKRSMTETSNGCPPTTLDECSNEARHDDVFANTVIPVSKSKQGGASVLYDVPKSSRQ